MKKRRAVYGKAHPITATPRDFRVDRVWVECRGEFPRRRTTAPSTSEAVQSPVVNQGRTRMSRFSSTPTTRHDIEREIQNLMSALDELKHEATRGSRHRLDDLRSRAESLWHDANWDEHCQELSRRGRQATRMATDCARKHPLSTLALAAGAVALIGYLATRR